MTFSGSTKKINSNAVIDGINLKKEINLFTGCAIIIGNIVGSGIFIASKGVFETTGSQGIALIVWIFSGLLSLIGAYCYTELGTLIQTSGGDYAYINESYGRFFSFLYIYMTVFVTFPCISAIYGMTVAVYTVKLIYPTCIAPEILIRILAALTITILSVVNLASVKLVSKIQTVFTFTKIGAIFIIIVSGFYNFISFNQNKTSEIISSWFETKNLNFNDISMSLYNGLFAFAGWNCLNFLTEEMKSPNKNLPRAIFISLPFITLIYVITNLVYFLVLSPAEILSSEAIALTMTDKTISGFPWLTSLFISISTVGALSSCILSASRACYAAARDGNLPQVFALISVKNCTPITSIFLQAFMSLLMLLVKDLNTLILYSTFSEYLFIGITISAVIYFRYSRPNAERPIKVNIIFPIIFLIVCIFLTILTVIQYPIESANGCIFLISGIPLYFIGILWENKPKSFNKLAVKITKTLQLLTMSVKED